MAETTCPRCGSRQPHLHPAVQFGGEVEVCAHQFHERETPQNRPEFIAAVRAKRAAHAAGVPTTCIEHAYGSAERLSETP